MIRTTLLVILSSTLCSAETVAQMVERARTLLMSRANNDRVEGRQLLHAATAECDRNLIDPGCADAYDWLGMVLQSSTNTADGLRDIVEPLYSKGVEARRRETHNDPSMALSLELDGMLLKTLGEQARGQALLDNAAELRKKSVLAMRSPEQMQAADPPRNVGRGVSPPKVLYRVEPSYTEEARLVRYAASVAISLVVDASGAPRDIKLTKGAGLGLDEQAVKAVQTWKFAPGTLNGDPVNVVANIEVNFRLL